jgi:hypothetical protein
MLLEDRQHKSKTTHSGVGVVFISPIIGLSDSMISTFDTLKEHGMDVEVIDTWEVQGMKKNLWDILRLTAFPGNHKKRIEFTNNYNEHRLFEVILGKIDDMIARGKKKIILGGMSSGFIFSSRIVQISLDDDLIPRAQKIKPFIRGLFGISPLIFYPQGVFKKGADLELIPSHIPTTLIWGDFDIEIPKETISHSQKISENSDNIKSLVIRGSDVGFKDGSIRHQFFGGKDFIKPLKNIFWNPKAEAIVINNIYDFIKNIDSKIVVNNHD